MKKYYRPISGAFAILSLIAAIITVCGILTLALESELIGLAVGMAVGGFLLFILFFVLFIVEFSNYIQISDIEISFPRNVRIITNTNTKRKTPYRRLTIKIKDIASVTKRYVRGDKIITNDTTFYNIKLHNGDSFEELFFHYGKKQEKEILSVLERDR